MPEDLQVEELGHDGEGPDRAAHRDEIEPQIVIPAPAMLGLPGERVIARFHWGEPRPPPRAANRESLGGSVDARRR